MRSLSSKLLLFNILLLFLPLGSLLYLDTYEDQLLNSQESSMIQQGRILSSALAGRDIAGESARILGNLGLRVDSRLRVVDRQGKLLADSATGGMADGAAGGPGEAKGPEAESAAERSANTNILYRIAVYPINAIKRMFFPPQVNYSTAEYYSGQRVLMGPEIQAALEGRYGAATRYSSGGQVSVNLYSAIPIRGTEPGEVIGAVLVSRSTYGILVNLYQLRLDIIRIFFISLLVSLILSLILSFSITIPVKRLKEQAETMLDKSGRFRGRFRILKRRDEIGDLSRSLSALSGRLERRISFIDNFTSDLLHELKNPLAAIRGSVELSLNSPVKEEKLLLGIQQEETRMERLLSRLRELSRIDNSLDQEETEAVDLKEFIPLLLTRYPLRDYPSTGVGFEDRSPGPALVRANPDRLAQALTNPIDNGISFSPPGERVLLSLGKGEAAGIRGWLVTVDDRGPGIREESGELFFERFYSERNQEEREQHSGLGLSIVKAIVRGYGGACSLENREGGGCRFSLVLPEISTPLPRH